MREEPDRYEIKDKNMKTHEKGNDDIKLCTPDFQRRALSSRTKSPLILHIPHASAKIQNLSAYQR